MITKTVFAGGQCEQLLLPVFGGILYIAMEYFRKDYPEKIASGKVIMVGLLTGIIFWVKYALCGISLGLVLYIAALSIKEKKPLDILHYALLFIVGFGAVTGAVFAYFIWKGALSSLIEVYFYDMLVNYKPESETSLICSDNIPKVFGVSVIFISAFLFPFVRSKEDKQINIYERTVLPVLIFFQGFGICLSRVWTYSPEAMHYFGVFGIIALFYESAAAKEMVQRIIDKLTEAFFKVTDNGFSDLFVLLPISIISVLFQYLRFGISSAARESVIHFAAFILIGCIVKILRMVQKKTGSAKKTIIVKYSLLLAAIVLLHLARSIPLCTYISDSFKICVFIFAFTDIVKYQKDIKNYFTQKFSKVFMHGIAFAVCLVIMGEFVSLVLTESPVALNIGLAADTYAPYNMAEIIKSSGVPDPVIINFDTLETGVYYFCDTYPPNRYMSDYNFQNGLFDFKKNYIDNKKADFIVMPHPIISEDYVCVYAKKREYIFMDTTDDVSCEVMALFARKDIAERNNWETVDLTAFKNEYMEGGDTDA
ncbi:MAG: hypothetical protein K6C68_05350 [Ruminococcus sp.]|nr:hypothetical protein [Ruminococcus sp.]